MTAFRQDMAHLELAQTLALVRQLDLGSGPVPFENYHGIDQAVGNELVTKFNLASGMPWPFADGSIEALYSNHFIEHVDAVTLTAWRFADVNWNNGATFPSPTPTHYLLEDGERDALVFVMEQAWRVAKEGALFRVRFPALVDERTGVLQMVPFLDPTHRRFIPSGQFHYFSRQGREGLQVAFYDWRCNWVPVSQQQNQMGNVGLEYDMTFRKEI